MHNSKLKIKDYNKNEVLKYRSLKQENESTIVSSIVGVLKNEIITETYFDNVEDYFGIEIIYKSEGSEKVYHLIANLHNQESIKEITNLIN